MLILPKWLSSAKSQTLRNSKGARRRSFDRSMRPALEALDQRLVPTTGVSANFAVTGAWASGFQAEMTLVNRQPASVANWRLEFDLDAQISSIWDATIVSQTGNHYVIEGAAWDPSLPAGGSASFGFVASAGQPATPSHESLNGVPLGESAPDVPALSIADAAVAEGNDGTTDLTFVVSLSDPAATAVSVNYATSDGSAQGGSDYEAAAGTLNFAPGETQKSVVVRVDGDLAAESDETLVVTLADPTGATLALAQAVGSINNDDAAPPTTTGAVDFQVTNDWGSGFNGELVITNQGAVPLNDWTLEFDFAGEISSIWSGSVVSTNGNHYVIQGADWNQSIAPGQSVSVGFTGSPGGTGAVLSNFVLNGQSTGGGDTGGTDQQAPTAVDDSAFTAADQPVAIDVLANDSDPNGDPLALTSYTQGQNGSVSMNTAGTLTYTPSAGYVGNDSFTYTITDGRGGVATATVAVTIAAPVAPSTWPAQFYAPYVDMGLYPTYNLAAAAQSSGIRYFTLAFIVADPQGQPSWAGYSEYAVNGGEFDLNVRSQVAAVRALGGDVMASFGGASGTELALAITDVDALTAAYQKVIDAYGLTHLDFDVEGSAAADRASIDRRSQAIANLQANAAAAGKPLEVWFTLPVLPTGLTPDGVYLLQSALQYGVQIAGVNLMTMDYGDSAAPNPEGRMGEYAIDAANSLFSQLQTLYGASRTDAQLWGMIGLTPMIGLNDVTTETFDQEDAAQLTAFAEQHGIGRISIWSLNRDKQAPAGELPYVDNESSSLVQQPFEFSKLFLPFQS